MIWDITKSIVLYRLITSPQFETAVLCLSLLLFLFFGAFVKLKNGFVSWLCFFILLAIPVSLLTINFININLPVEDLKLSDVISEQYQEVTGDGIVFKRRFRRTVTEPLLGISATTNVQRIDDLATFIKKTYPDGTMFYRTSKKYSGIMLVDTAGNDINCMLLHEGYVNVASKTPSQYLIAVNNARKRGVGIWAITTGLNPNQIFECTFYVFCFVLGIVFMQYYAAFKRATPYTITVSIKENNYGKEEERSVRSDNDSSDSGTTTRRGKD